MPPEPWQQRFARQMFRASLRHHQVTDAQLRRLLRDAARHAANIVADTVDQPGIGQAVRRALYDQSRIALAQMEEELWTRIGRRIRAGVTDITGVVVEHQADLIRAMGRLTPRQQAEVLRGLERAAETAAERVRASLLSRYDLSPRIYRNQALMRGQVDRVVSRGILLNSSAREIAADVSRLIRPNVPGGTSYNAMRLSRTELSNAFRATASEAYSGQPWVEGVKWELSGSHPQPDVCDDLAHDDANGLGPGVFPPHAVPQGPHPHCLCHTSPVTISREDFASRLRNGDFNGWLESRGFQPI